MRYLGGKSRHGETIARFVRSKRTEQYKTIWEPFCGACWVSQHFYPAPIVCSDIFKPLIVLHETIQAGHWVPPDFISEEQYNILHQQWKDGECNPWIGFAGFACSWGGKWFAGYSRGDNRNFCLEAKQSLLKKHKRLKNVLFLCRNFKSANPCNEVIYCDPPYRGTVGYHGEIFDTLGFWKIIRKWSKNNRVIVSEYVAPPDFKIIWQAEHVSMKSTNSKTTVEKLFMLE